VPDSRRAPKAKKRCAPAHAAALAEKEDNKRLRSTIDQVADDYLCPISQELPVDPVTAEDGRIYERTEIEEHIRLRRRTGDLRSPMTNEKMGKKLFPSAQTRSVIQKLVTTGAIGGDKAARWKERMEERLKDAEALQTWRRQAEGGNCAAMWELGEAYFWGEHGLKVDEAAGYAWYKKGADLNDARCLGSAGDCLLRGRGVDIAQRRLGRITPLQVHGAVLMTRAAGLGSRHASFCLGESFDEGSDGLPKDAAQARHWYARVADGAIDDIRDDGEREKAAERLQRLAAEEEEGEYSDDDDDDNDDDDDDDDSDTSSSS
jgi:hypothetical protein